MGEACHAWSSLLPCSIFFKRGDMGYSYPWFKISSYYWGCTEQETNRLLLEMCVMWSQGRCGYVAVLVWNHSHPLCEQLMEYFGRAVHQWWFCSWQSIVHSHTKWKYSLGGLQIHIFTSLNYTLFSQGCMIQVKKEVILQLVCWLLIHGNELVSQFGFYCQLPSFLRTLLFKNPTAGSSHASPTVPGLPILGTNHLTMLLATGLGSPVLEEGIYLLLSCLFTKIVHTPNPLLTYKIIKENQVIFSAPLYSQCFLLISHICFFLILTIPAASALCWHNRVLGYKTKWWLGAENMSAFPSCRWDSV